MAEIAGSEVRLTRRAEADGALLCEATARGLHFDGAAGQRLWTALEARAHQDTEVLRARLQVLASKLPGDIASGRIKVDLSTANEGEQVFAVPRSNNRLAERTVAAGERITRGEIGLLQFQVERPKDESAAPILILKLKKGCLQTFDVHTGPVAHQMIVALEHRAAADRERPKEVTFKILVDRLREASEAASLDGWKPAEERFKKGVSVQYGWQGKIDGETVRINAERRYEDGKDGPTLGAPRYKIKVGGLELESPEVDAVAAAFAKRFELQETLQKRLRQTLGEITAKIVRGELPTDFVRCLPGEMARTETGAPREVKAGDHIFKAEIKAPAGPINLQVEKRVDDRVKAFGMNVIRHIVSASLYEKGTVAFESQQGPAVEALFDAASRSSGGTA